MDPAYLEVFSGAFRSLAGKMAEVLSDAAMSPAVRHCRDCSTALYSPEGRLVALAGGRALHPGTLPGTMAEVLKVYPADTLSQGDCIITNDPYLTGSPLYYLLAVSPVFCGGRLQALAASVARHEDMGGLSPGGVSGDIFQEGVRIPPVRIIRKGNINSALASLLSSNVRGRKKFMGDLRAQVAASRSAEKKLTDLSAKYGPERIGRYMAEIINHSEGRMRSALKKLPPGERRLEDIIEWDGLPGGPYKICIAISAAEESLTVDFTGTSPQAGAPVNITAFSAQACVYQAALSAMAPGGTVNEGMFSSIKVIAPAGSLVSAGFPAPVAYGNLITARQVTGAVYRCLKGIAPGGHPFGHGRGIIISIGGLDPGSGSYYSWTEAIGGGGDAGCPGDGPDGCHAAPAADMPVEAFEQSFPLMVNSFGLIDGSGGPGKFRGGMGVSKTVTVLGGSGVFSAYPWGRGQNPRDPRGGRPGRNQYVSLKQPGPVEKEYILLPGEYTGALGEGASITLETSGGAGFGSPRERDPDAVRLDVLEGIISKDQAEEVYGVVLAGEDLEVDLEATALRRSKL